jgi:FixJ family two-component response regulator
MSARRQPVGIVDDDPAVRRALARLVRAHGFRVRAFDSAEEFWAAGPLDACLLIVDVDLPGASGLELVERLDLARHPLPVVLLSGRAETDASFAAEAKRVGAVAALKKPVDADALVAVIARHCPLGIT